MKRSMKSPIHRDLEMVEAEIEPGLNAYRCPKSNGVWMPMPSYLDWLQRRGAPVKPLPEGYKPQTIKNPSRSALICPESGCILTRFRVGHGLDFQLDRSNVTGGVWLDPGEWEALKSKELHDHLHLIFTASYQHEVRDEAAAERHQQILLDKLGESDLGKVDDFATWLARHPEKRFILGHLMELVKF